jgi:hypothetical protein
MISGAGESRMSLVGNPARSLHNVTLGKQDFSGLNPAHSTTSCPANAGHPRLCLRDKGKAWMPGVPRTPSRAMTISFGCDPGQNITY